MVGSRYGCRNHGDDPFWIRKMTFESRLGEISLLVNFRMWTHLTSFVDFDFAAEFQSDWDLNLSLRLWSSQELRLDLILHLNGDSHNLQTDQGLETNVDWGKNRHLKPHLDSDLKWKQFDFGGYNKHSKTGSKATHHPFFSFPMCSLWKPKFRSWSERTETNPRPCFARPLFPPEVFILKK